ncbi:unnamed protein product [Ambrosiozyma monospora]|uniref:Unnamed protein product n=1 Tax=Ambrosiozyma monospora TaxID=43982 RepID=A0ACB5T0Z6_AMBMO|nr:unnamed protein product [Ambrosiozyma monospora]
MDHGIILPTGLCSLTWHNNIYCFTLPKILNIGEILDLKTVSVQIDPFKFNDSCDGVVLDYHDDPINKKFLQISNTCTIGQLQQFVSQLPTDLEILKININGYIRHNLDSYSTCCPAELSFKRFANLDCFEMDCLNNVKILTSPLFLVPNVSNSLHLRFSNDALQRE